MPGFFMRFRSHVRSHWHIIVLGITLEAIHPLNFGDS